MFSMYQNNRGDKAAWAMRVGPRPGSKKCGTNSVFQPADLLQPVPHNLQSARANSGAGQGGLAR